MREIENPDERKKSMDDGTPYQLIDLLHQRNVPVVLIGGHAVVYHGYVRSTEDVDVLFLRNAESERNLLIGPGAELGYDKSKIDSYSASFSSSHQQTWLCHAN